MSKTVLDDIKKEMDSLRDGYESWSIVEGFFKNNERLKNYYADINDPCVLNNYLGRAIMVTRTIEKLLEEIDDLKDEIFED